MRKPVSSVPNTAVMVESDSDGIPYEWDYSVELHEDKGEDAWYVVYTTSTGTCELCGGETYDIDKFDNEAEARTYYDECVSKEWW